MAQGHEAAAMERRREAEADVAAFLDAVARGEDEKADIAAAKLLGRVALDVNRIANALEALGAAGVARV